MPRKTKFTPEHVELARTMAESGATDAEIAMACQIHLRNFHRWKAVHPELRAALKVGKEVPDQLVERTLLERARGYSYPAVKIFYDAKAGRVVRVPYIEHVEPDVTAQIFWLKNRKPEQWRDVKAVEHSGAIRHEHVEELSDSELQRIAAGGGAGTAQKAGGKGKSRSVH